MSRLEGFIRRMQAQRDCLNRAAELIGAMEGAVLELGLGNGRTYDHLHEILPGREIFVFERKVAAHLDCIPDGDHLFEGDIGVTLPAASVRLAGRAAFAHCDIGSGDQVANRAHAAFVARSLAPLPASVEAERYHLYRVRQ